jgi:hypothetical protein
MYHHFKWGKGEKKRSNLIGKNERKEICVGKREKKHNSCNKDPRRLRLGLKW